MKVQQATVAGVCAAIIVSRELITLLGDGYDIRTVQELLGHNDVSTTMIYGHVQLEGGLIVRSPVARAGG